MYKFKEIRSAHIELTSNCQASCPMCARNHHGGIENPLLKVTDIDLESFKQICPPNFLQQIEHITLCGNFGDPILNKELIPIVQHITTINPSIKIDVHTNGSARSTAWWKELATALPADHLVLFGIDGLEDTHALYRIGTDFNKIIENAKAFISAGGKARWNFITFKHNEHQLDACRKLAGELGFESFQEKQTSRFIGNPWFDAVDRNGNVTHRLENPSEQKVIFIDRKTVENYKEVIKLAKIQCEVEKTLQVYIDAQSRVWPCCFIGATPYVYTTKEQLVHNYQTDSLASFSKLVDSFGGMDMFSLKHRSLEEIIDSNDWQTKWDSVFADNSVHVCARVCGKFPEPTISQCRDQFLELEEF
jgi:MoaA/NifB/PqqE/SkfB family radical SAM enzyme